jgi:hypothetical protein
MQTEETGEQCRDTFGHEHLTGYLRYRSRAGDIFLSERLDLVRQCPCQSLERDYAVR